MSGTYHHGQARRGEMTLGAKGRDAQGSGQVISSTRELVPNINILHSRVLQHLSYAFMTYPGK